MNTKAIELMEKAGLLTQLGGPYPKALNAKECMTAYNKLIELVVCECTNMIPDSSVHDKYGVHIFYTIREHFGIPTICD